MVDWPGLLKWSTNFHDKDATDLQKKEMRPMDNERRQWLTEAMQAFHIDEAALMEGIIKDLKTHKDDEETLLQLLDRLDETLEGLSNSLDFCTLGGMALLLDMVRESEFPAVRMHSALIIAICAQNNVDIQEYLLDSSALLLINTYLNEKSGMARAGILSVISAMVRGTNLRSKRVFLDAQGLQLIRMIIRQGETEDFGQNIKER